MTRNGGRDQSTIIEIRSYFDRGDNDVYLSLPEHLGPSLQLIREFPLLRLEQNDLIIKINDIDVRQSNPEQFLAILKGLTINEKAGEPLSVGKNLPTAKDEFLYLTYIKGTDVRPEKHLSKGQVIVIA